MKTISRLVPAVAALVLISSSASAQQYDAGYDQDYAQDNLYADYAAKQQDKAVAGGGGYV